MLAPAPTTQYANAMQFVHFSQVEMSTYRRELHFGSEGLVPSGFFLCWVQLEQWKGMHDGALHHVIMSDQAVRAN